MTNPAEVIHKRPVEPKAKIVAYLVTGLDGNFDAIVFTDTVENAQKAGENGLEAVWGIRDAVKVSRYPKYDAKYVPGMKVNECLDPLVVDETWDADE